MRLFSLLFLAMFAGCAAAPAPEAPVRGLAIPVRDPTPRTPDDDDPREAAPEAEPERPFALPAVVRESLPGGAELLVVPQKGSPVVELRAVVRGAGSAGDGAWPGLASLVLRLALDAGPPRPGLKDPLERLRTLGALPAREVTPEAARLAAAVPREQVSEVVTLWMQALREARLEGPDVARARKLERGLRAAQGEPGVVASLELRHLFQGAPQEPTAAGIERIPAAELKGFYRQRYAPGAVALVVVGDVDAAALKATLTQALAPWKAAGAAAPAPALKARGDRLKITMVDVPGRAGVDLWLLSPGPAPGAEGSAEAALAAELLGGAPGARLGVALAGHGTGGQASLRELGPVSSLRAQASAEPAKAAAALGAMLDALGKAAEPAGEAELTGAKRRAIRAYQQQHAAPASLADELARQAGRREPAGASQQQLERLKGADAAAVARAARELGVGALAVAIGDAAQVASSLARWGEVTVVSPDRELERVRVLPETPSSGEKKQNQP